MVHILHLYHGGLPPFVSFLFTPLPKLSRVLHWSTVFPRKKKGREVKEFKNNIHPPKKKHTHTHAHRRAHTHTQTSRFVLIALALLVYSNLPAYAAWNATLHSQNECATPRRLASDTLYGNAGSYGQWYSICTVPPAFPELGRPLTGCHGAPGSAYRVSAGRHHQ